MNYRVSSKDISHIKMGIFFRGLMVSSRGAFAKVVIRCLPQAINALHV